MKRLVPIAAVLVATAAGTLGVRAAGLGSGPSLTSALPPLRPVITVVPDSAPARPGTTASPTRSAATPQPAADAHGTGIPDALPAYTPPERSADACESQAVAHPTGFTQMGGSGSDAITDHGTSTTYTVYRRHAALQYVCTGGTADGGIEVDAVLQPVGADADTFVFDMSPGGVTLVSITPGRAAKGAQPVTVNQRLASWPTGGCGSVSLPGITDTFCFHPDGSLRHLELHEQETYGAVSRNLSASLDDFPTG